LDSLDRLSLVKDNLIRQNILEIVLEWIQDPKAVGSFIFVASTSSLIFT
jgi:hypothetical protein